jgi:hypothetical protein
MPGDDRVQTSGKLRPDHSPMERRDLARAVALVSDGFAALERNRKTVVQS